MMVEGVRPYIMDLGSVNGTFVNNERIEGERYYELLEQVSFFKVDGTPGRSHTLQPCLRT
jgi:pSer/pThr/pTyr-binding forkhead associated (FHA) protein